VSQELEKLSGPDLEEQKRLEALTDLGLLDRPQEERFQRITRLARQHFRAGICTITLIDEERAHYLAQDGLDTRAGGPRESTMCNRVVIERAPVVVADLSKEAATAVYQNLVERLKLFFYAGVPIMNVDGYVIGALCVMDHIPRRFSRRELESLADFASIVEDEILIRRAGEVQRELVSQVEKLRLRAYVDQLTGVWNRAAVFDILERELDRAERNDQSICVCMLDLDDFKQVNDTYGHQAGDEVLQELCRRLRSSIRPYDSIGRYGGEEFLVVFPETTARQAQRQAERIREVVEQDPFEVQGGEERTITVSIGVANYTQKEELNQLISRADAALYRAKRGGKNKVVLDETS